RLGRCLEHRAPRIHCGTASRRIQSGSPARAAVPGPAFIPGIEMPENASEIRIRPLDELDISDIVAIDEKIGGRYRPEVWERRIGYYLRRDPEASLVAVADGRVVGFMLGEVRTGDFGLEEPAGWIEVLGVDPDFRGRAAGRTMAEEIV